MQRRLLDPALPAPERAAANRELEQLEIQEADLRNQLARTAPALDASRRPDFATLARVRQALGADEALLSFQISSWEDERGDFAGGSWLLATTRGGTRAYRLPARGELRPAVRLFNGTFERPGRLRRRPAAESLPAAAGAAAARAAAGRPAAGPGAGRRPPPAPVRGAPPVAPRRRRSPRATS